MELGYWPIRGLGEINRLLLAYLNVPYTEYNPTGLEEWTKKKAQMVSDGEAFPNLPYIKHNGKYVFESFALHYYIPQSQDRMDLWGKTNCDKVKVRTFYGVAYDMYKKTVNIIY